MSRTFDDIDRRLIGALCATPRATVTSLASSVGVTRSTIQLRLERLIDRETIIGFGPDLNPAATGFGVVAFVSLSISQGAHEAVVDSLTKVPEVLEVHTVTGGGDLLCKVVARSNDDLHEILQRVVASPEIVRTETQLSLSNPINRKLADLVARS
ncbi:MAG: Lrp/AsnC family transcriptional regulator [Actinobacteria bacterium]|nr:Lrp/AsnC family transcriptional regulator [Actinomycetota bacterium]